MAGYLRSERGRDATFLRPIAVLWPKVRTNERLQVARLGEAALTIEGCVHGVDDRFRHERFLGRKMTVEPTVRQTSVAHQPGDAHGVDPVLAETGGGDFED